MTAAATDDPSLALLQLLAHDDGVSIHRAAKRLGLGLSELRRLLAAMGSDTAIGGLDLIEARAEGARELLYLTDKGRRLCRTS